MALPTWLGEAGRHDTNVPYLDNLFLGLEILRNSEPPEKVDLEGLSLFQKRCSASCREIFIKPHSTHQQALLLCICMG